MRHHEGGMSEGSGPGDALSDRGWGGIRVGSSSKTCTCTDHAHQGLPVHRYRRWISCWSSSGVEHVLGKDGVTGSIPVSSSSDCMRELQGQANSPGRRQFLEAPWFRLASPCEIAERFGRANHNQTCGDGMPNTVRVRPSPASGGCWCEETVRP